MYTIYVYFISCYFFSDKNSFRIVIIISLSLLLNKRVSLVRHCFTFRYLFFYSCPIILHQAYFVCPQIKLSISLFSLAAGVRGVVSLSPLPV